MLAAEIVWQGMTAMRISVSHWMSIDAGARRSVQVIRRFSDSPGGWNHD